LGGCDDLLADIAAGTLDARLQRAGITVRPPAAAFEADDDDWSAELDISPVGGILNHHQPPAGGASGSVSEAARALQSLVSAETSEEPSLFEKREPCGKSGRLGVFCDGHMPLSNCLNGRFRVIYVSIRARDTVPAGTGPQNSRESEISPSEE
jgi:hypothetical protein